MYVTNNKMHYSHINVQKLKFLSYYSRIAHNVLNLTHTTKLYAGVKTTIISPMFDLREIQIFCSIALKH